MQDSQSIIPLTPDPKSNGSKKTDNSLQTIKKTHTEELIIGICGLIGTDIHRVSENIEKVLTDQFGYECEIIKLSSFIKDYGTFETSSPDGSPDFIKKMDYINEGNHLRKKHGNSILAELAINKIIVDRQEENGEESNHFKSRRKCYILDSIKNQDEEEILRTVYRDLFYFISVFSPKDSRIKKLQDQGLTDLEIFQLIDRDSGEELSYGQTVRITFTKADLFLRIDNDSDPILQRKIKRFLDLIFNTEIHTPTQSETAMYHAFSAAGNSACLSRQVGASITDSNGNLISIGWNDVPRFGGNLYMNNKEFEDSTDLRCVNIDGGKCFNDQEKISISNQIVTKLINEGLISEDKRDSAKKVLINSKVRSLVEFSRSVHAEMHAIIMGAQKTGSSMIGGKLFCTTYPCHMCARHIIVAGIKEIYYIEPYTKSLTLKLHYDAITEDEHDSGKVRILMFDGISPKRYLDLFKLNFTKRKNSVGKKVTHSTKKGLPVSAISLEAIPTLESAVTRILIEKGIIENEE